MISSDKLQKLPRHQRLRKIEKILTLYEYQLVGKPLVPEVIQNQYLKEIIRLLSVDTEFEKPMEYAISALNKELQTAIEQECTEAIRGTVNRVRHLLLSYLGKTVADWDFIDAQGNLYRRPEHFFKGLQVFFEDIRSPFNVGSMFRTAESFGVEKIYISPFCADPTHPRAARSSMGCVSVVPWERTSVEMVDGPMFALETGGTPLDEFTFPENAVMIVGSEELGVSPQTLRLADASFGRVSIPTMGAKGSLNVGVAFGIAMHRWAEERIKTLKVHKL